MNTIEELNQIKIANMIINRGSQRLGIKPVYVGELINTKTERKPVDELKIIAQKLSQEKFLKRNLKKNLKFLNLFNLKNLKIVFFALLAATVVYSLMFVFKPAAVRHQAETETQSSTGLSDESTGIFKADQAHGMLITSGAFKTRAEAEKFRDELSEKLGVPLEILHDSKYFTVQIGPSYENHADAMVVFDELSRYSIGNLSLRAAG